MNLRSFVLACLVGVLAASSVALVRTFPIVLEPSSSGYRRLVGGATPSGRVLERATISLPGLPRDSPGHLTVRWPSSDDRVEVGAAVDGAPVFRSRSLGALVVDLPPALVPGARLELWRLDGAPPPTMGRVEVTFVPRYRLAAVMSFLLVSVTTGFIAARRGTRVALSAGLVAAGAAGFLSTPSLLWASVPAPSAVLRLCALLGLVVSSVLMGLTSKECRRAYLISSALVLALLFGAAVRCYFLPSAGSWDTEYWKAWMHRSVSHGVTQAYGGPVSTPRSQFWSQLRGEEPLWQVEYKGRSFAVDYPPLAMAAWAASWAMVRTLMPSLETGEAENVAVKIPPVLGDVLAVVLLLWLFRREPLRGATLAALYWALPVSWLSSGALGFLDGAYVPFMVVGLALAGRGYAVGAGAVVAIAALIKPQALLIVPAAAVALSASGARLRWAAAAGLGVVALVLTPFAVAGTLEEALVHVYRILFQERLSAGFANPWWIAGHLLATAKSGISALAQPVDYASVRDLPFPPQAIALPAFALGTTWFVWALRDRGNAARACLAGAGIVFAYSMFALGVHENHPHPIFLALLATGLRSFRMQIVAGCAATSYVLNMLSLSAMGRFYGSRYMAFEPWAASISKLRMEFGFDLTLALALLNIAVFVLLLISTERSAGSDRSRDRVGNVGG